MGCMEILDIIFETFFDGVTWNVDMRQYQYLHDSYKHFYTCHITLSVLGNCGHDSCGTGYYEEDAAWAAVICSVSALTLSLPTGKHQVSTTGNVKREEGSLGAYRWILGGGMAFECHDYKVVKLSQPVYDHVIVIQYMRLTEEQQMQICGNHAKQAIIQFKHQHY